MKLKELKQIAGIDEVLVIHTDKDGDELKNELIVLLSQTAKYDEEEVVSVEAHLRTSEPDINGTIQVSPCLQVCVLHQEE